MGKVLVTVFVTLLLLAGCRTPSKTPGQPQPPGSPFQPLKVVQEETSRVEPGIARPEYTGVFFADAEHGWVVGSGGDQGSTNVSGFVTLTADGGKSWTRVDLRPVRPVQVTFVDDETGWVLAEDRLLVTGDGGRTWTERYRAAHVRLTRVQFLDRQKGFALVRRDGPCTGWICPSELWATSDGGKTWAALPTRSFEPASFTFVDARNGWAVGVAGAGTKKPRAAVFATRDGGRTWAEQLQSEVPADTAPGGNFSVSFVNEREGWAQLPTKYGCTMGGCWGPLYHTADGGRHWERLQDQGWSGGASGTPGWPGDVYFANSQQGWIPASGGAGPGRGGVAVTRDGGRTWARTGGDWNVKALASVGGRDLWLVGSPHTAIPQGFLVHSRDAGQTWEQVFPTPTPTLDLTFLDKQHGFGIGTASDQGAVLATDDGGRTWRQVTSLSGAQLSKLNFVDALVGWVVTGGEAPQQIVRTEDGGLHWGAVDSPKDPVIALQFFDAVHGVRITQALVGAATTYALAFSDDGGKTWSNSEAVSLQPWLQAIRFIDSRQGLAVRLLDQRVTGTPVLVLEATRDGGATWTDVGTLPLASEVAMDFLSRDRGWLLDGNRLLATSDGGKTWRSYLLGDLEPVVIRFRNGNDGWLVTRAGDVYHTEDGGKTWR